MTRLAECAAERLSPEHLVVASDALLVRLQRISQTVSELPAGSSLLVRARADHVAAAEALLNLVSVLREDGRCAGAASRIDGDLSRALASARSWF